MFLPLHRLRDLLHVTMELFMLSDNLQVSLCPSPDSLFPDQQTLGAGVTTHCQTPQGHWGEEDVPPQIISQPRCKTGQRKAVLALRHYFQDIWQTLLPPQMLVWSLCKTSLEELGYLTPTRAGGGHQNKACSKESLPALNHRDQRGSELQTHHLFQLVTVGVPTPNVLAAMNPTLGS